MESSYAGAGMTNNEHYERNNMTINTIKRDYEHGNTFTIMNTAINTIMNVPMNAAMNTIMNLTMNLTLTIVTVTMLNN